MYGCVTHLMVLQLGQAGDQDDTNGSGINSLDPQWESYRSVGSNEGFLAGAFGD